MSVEAGETAILHATANNDVDSDDPNTFNDSTICEMGENENESDNDNENQNMASAADPATETDPATSTRTTDNADNADNATEEALHRYRRSTLRSSIILQQARDVAQAQERQSGVFQGLAADLDDNSEGYEAGSSDPDWLAENLAEQPWHEIGNCDGALRATNNFELMVDQLTSIFLVRLKDLVVSKPLYAHEFLDNFGLELCEELRTQLRLYIREIGARYNEVHYHAFSHATHVTISVNKLLSMVLNDHDIRVETTMHNTNSSPAGGDAESHHGGGGAESHAGGGTTHSTNGGGRRRATLQHIGAVPGRRVSLGSVDSYHGDSRENDADKLHEATFGIYNNGLLRFALMFSALIHDVDHQGVPNSTLVDEEDDLAILHNDLSVAEQNSLQIAFSTLTQKRFALLKKSIIPDKETRKEFRRTVIDMVLATDISNPERMQIAQSKWNEAFEPPPPTAPPPNSTTTVDSGSVNHHQHEDDVSTVNEEDNNNDPFTPHSRRNSNVSKASSGTMSKRHSLFVTAQSLRQIQIEKLGLRKSVDFGGKMVDVYASTSEGELKLKQHAVTDLMMNVVDVAHTMQSFGTFVKWNKRLFKELLTAYHADRISWDPTMGWYGNQIQFYDAYIIPLAKKMQKCGVFGAKSSVFLYFAMENKRRWVVEGAEITEQMVDQVAKEVLIESLQAASDASNASQCSSSSSSLSDFR